MGRWFAWGLCAAVLLLVDTAARAEPSGRAQRIWTPEERWLRVQFPETNTGDANLVAAERTRGPLRIGPHEVLLSEVRAGDVIRVRGDSVALGLAAANHVGLEGLVFRDGVRELRVPAWSSEHFVALRSSGPETAHVTVERARSPASAFHLYRLEQAFARSLRDPRTRLPNVDPDVDAATRYVSALRALLSTGAVSASVPRDNLLNAAYARELAQEWPLVAPYFFQTSGEPLVGGQRVVVEGEPQTRLTQGERVKLEAAPRAVVVWSVRPVSPGRTRVRVRVAGHTVRVLERALGPTPDAQYGDALHFRTAAELDPAALTLEVEAGSALVQARVYRRAPALFGPNLVRAMDAIPDAEAGGPLLRAFFAWLTNDRDAELEALTRTLDESEWSPGARALFASWLLELTPVEAPSLGQRLRAAHERIARLPASVGLPLWRHALKHLVQAGVRLEHVPDIPWTEREGADEQDVMVSRALTRLLGGPQPDIAGAAAFSDYSLRHPDAELDRLARRLWLRSGALRLLPPEGNPDAKLQFSVPQDAHRADGRCDPSGSAGLRWTSLDRARVVDVQATGASHTAIVLRSLDVPAARDEVVHIDGVPVVVHGSVGLSGHAAVRPGLHRFAQAPGVMALIPRDGSAPCDELRAARRLYRADPELRFLLPEAGAPSFVRIEVGREDAQEAPRGWVEVRVDVDKRAYTAYLQAGRDGVEVPIPSGARVLRLRTSRPAWLRARMRLARDPSPAREGVVLREEAPSDPEDDLQEIGDLTQRILEERHEDRLGDLLRERARLLRRLGQSSLADADLARAARLPPPASIPAFRGAVGPRAKGRALEAGAPDVVPTGLASRIGPLTAPEQSGRFRRALSYLRYGCSAAELRKSYPDPVPHNAEALLWAILAERAGLAQVAAETWATLARSEDAPGAMARAAAQMADASAAPGLSRTEQERRLLLAWGYSYEAEALGADVAGVRMRLAPFVEFTSIEHVEQSLGTALLEQRATTGDAVDAELSLGQRVRRALLDTPAAATWLASERRLTLHMQGPEPLRVAYRCQTLDGVPCALKVRVDGLLRPCVSAAARPAAGADICSLAIAPGAHRIELAFEGDRTTFGWVAPSTARGEILQKHLVSHWHELDGEHPLRMTVLGPTVVRLRARSVSEVPLMLHVELATRAGVRQTAELALSGTPDPAATFYRPDGKPTSPSGSQAERAIVVYAEEAVHLSVKSPGGRALLQAAVAEPVNLQALEGLGHARLAKAQEEPAELSEERDWLAEDEALPNSIASPRARGPFTTSASYGFVARNLMEGDKDRRGLYGELAVSLRRQLVKRLLWGRTSLLQRARHGHDSAGGEVSLHMMAQGGAIPGFFLFGRGMLQSSGAGPARGGSLSAGIRWSLRARPDLRVLPFASASLRATDARLANAKDADPDVYSAWAHANPRSFDTGLSLIHWPFVDALFFYSAWVRSTPDLNGVDRVQGRAQLETAPGRGHAPVVTINGTLGYRPVTSYRANPFTRLGGELDCMLFHWLGENVRVALSGQLAARVDAQAGSLQNGALYGFLVLSVDHMPGTGVSDFAPYERRFRDRLEEGRHAHTTNLDAPMANWTDLDGP